MNTFHVYTSPADVTTFDHVSDDIDVVTDAFLETRDHDPSTVEFDCISDHITMCYVDDALLYIVCRDPQTTLALAEMFH